MESGPIETRENPGQEASVDFYHLWHVIMERRWLALTAFVSVVVLCVFYLLKATPIYRAIATIQINRESENVLNLKDAFAVEGQDTDYLQTQYKNLLSRALIAQVVTNSQLYLDPYFSNSVDVTSAAMKCFDVVPYRMTRLIEIRAEHPNPVMAAKMANALGETFTSNNIQQRISKSDLAVKNLMAEADEYKLAKETNQQALLAFTVANLTNNAVSLDETRNINVQALKEAQTKYDEARTAASAARQTASHAEAYVLAGNNLLEIPEIANDGNIQLMRRDLASKTADLANLLQRHGEKMPDVIGLRSETNQLGHEIERQAAMVFRSVKIKADTQTALETEALQSLDKLKQEAAKLDELKTKYNRLEQNLKQSDFFYQMLLQKIKETELTAKVVSQNVFVRDPAIVPRYRVKPRRVWIMALGLIGGVFTGIGLALFVNYLDDSIKSQDDVETYLKLPFLGYVPNIKTNSIVERDLQAHLHPQSNAAEGFRTIRATVSLASKTQKQQMIAVTSTIPSEGKSLVATNFAVVLAQTGMKTLIVDADLRRPFVHKAFQLQSPIGLSAYLMEKVNNVEEITHTSEVPNLDVVCCGAIPASPAELLDSKRMMQFLKDARERYDRIIIDTPPISAVSDPLIMGALADGILFVTKFNKIRREHARKSVMRIQNAGIRILGVVLNDIDFEGRDSYYYSYYYYQNRYYATHYQSTPGAPGSGAPPDFRS